MTDYTPLIPYTILIVLAIVVALLGTIPAVRAGRWLGCLTAVGALLALYTVSHGSESSPWEGSVRFDSYSKAFNGVFLITLALISIASVAEEKKTAYAGEYYALLMLSTMGLMLMASCGSLITLYLGLELSTISLIALAAFSRHERRSAEAAVKLLVLGSVASAVVLYGSSILYGVLGTTQFSGMAAALASDGLPLGSISGPALWLGITFIIGGLAFKVAAVPFHLWAPDVYEGSPALVTAFLSTASKAGGFAALLRFLIAIQSSDNREVTAIIVALSALSMLIGNLCALSQTNLKRMLGYSGIAQSGYILVAIASGVGSGRGATVGSVLMYLLLYALTNVGAFLLAQAVFDATGSDKIVALRGLHRRCPSLAFCAVVLMFSLGGIPPLAGFVGKLYLFAAAWEGGQQGLVVLGALASVIALYYYLMVVRQIYITDPEDGRRLSVARPIGLAITLCTIGILAIGIYPKPLISLGERASEAIVSSVKPVQKQVARY